MTVQKMTRSLAQGGTCSTGLAMLKSQVDILDKPGMNLFDAEEYTSSVVEEACPIIQRLD